MIMFLLIFCAVMLLFINGILQDIQDKLSSLQDEVDNLSSIASEFEDLDD